MSGFDENSDADVVIKTIADFLVHGGRKGKVSKVDFFSDPTSIGVIWFETIQADIDFYKKNTSNKRENGKTMTFDDNNKFEQRVRERL